MGSAGDGFDHFVLRDAHPAAAGALFAHRPHAAAFGTIATLRFVRGRQTLRGGAHPSSEPARRYSHVGSVISTFSFLPSNIWPRIKLSI